MKILQVIGSVDPDGGGPMEGVRQFCLLAAEGEHQVEVCSLDVPGSAFLASFPARVHALGPVRTSYAYTNKLLPWLRKNVARFDVVVVNGLWQFHSFAVWRVLRKTAIPYLVFTHGMLDPWFKHTYPLKHLKKWLYWPWGEYRVLRDAHSVLFTCEEEKTVARKSFELYRANEVVVNFGTARPSGNAVEQRGKFFERFPHLQNKRLALFLGRIHPKKGCDLLIEAFATVLKHDPQWHLVMAGPDQVGWREKLAEEAERLGIADRITWTGMLGGDLKWGALHASEIFALPSHQENFGIAVAEALACGLVPLISNKVNIWREVEADGAGLVGQDNAAATSELLRTWIAMTEEHKQRMRTQALDCFERRFEGQMAFASLLTHLAGAAGRSAAAPVLVQAYEAK